MDEFTDDELGPDRIPLRDKVPKNKYGLTEEEIKSMETMTPKEKKKFLKGRSHV